MLAHHGFVPDGRRGEQRQHLAIRRREVRLEHPPAEQRNVRILHHLVMPEHRRDERHRLRRIEPTRGRRKLRQHLRIQFPRGLRLQRGKHRRRDVARLRLLRDARVLAGAEIAIQAPLVAEQPCRPHAHRRETVLQGRHRSRLVERARLMQRPEGVQRTEAGVTREQLLERRGRGGIAALAEQAHGGAAMPLVGMREQGDELRGALRGEVEVLFARRVATTQPVHAARVDIDLVLVVLTVRDVEVVHVAHVERAVGRVRDVHRPERRVGAAQRRAGVGGLERRAAGRPLGRDHDVVQRIEREELAAVLRGQRRAVGECAEVGEPHHGRRRFHHRQFAERVRVARRPEFARVDALHEVEAALDIMPAARLPAVVAGVEPALGVELETEGVAAALGENLVGARVRVITPHHAALEVHAGRGRRIEAGPRDATRRRAALSAVQPAVGSPDETVRRRVRVLEAEAREPDFGRAVGNVVPIAVRVEQQVRRVHHPHTAATADRGVGHVETVEKHLVRIVYAVALGRFVD